MFHLPFDIYPFLRPIFFSMDPESAHKFSIACLKNGFFPVTKIRDAEVLHTKVCGIDFDHPIGLAAGYDKQAEVIQQIFKLGFAFAEVGGVTPLPQSGNPRPRMFRLEDSKAVINRFNFNSIGFDACLRNVEAWHDQTTREHRHVVGINIARGDNCTDDAEAYSLGLKKFAPYVHFVTINISCPNEPNSCNLQGRDQLTELLQRIKMAHDVLEKKPRLFVKISPDQTEKQARDIAEVALASGIDGMIVGNTTATRPASVTSPIAKEKGGLSGKPLFEMSTKLLGMMYQMTEGKIPLIGCGGVFSGADAYAKIRAGASLVQIYTAMVFEGPFVIARITDELAALLKRDGFASVGEAVGADFKKA